MKIPMSYELKSQVPKSAKEFMELVEFAFEDGKKYFLDSVNSKNFPNDLINVPDLTFKACVKYGWLDLSLEDGSKVEVDLNKLREGVHDKR